MDDFDASDEGLVEAILDRELETYRNDPNRLTSDYADEDEIARDHAGRAIWEILQNADDSMAPEGADSARLIGSKGIGFKAVLELSAEPEIHSPPFHFSFSSHRSEDLLRRELGIERPPPLTFRIPHPCDPFSSVQELLAEGFATVLRLPLSNADAQGRAASELNSLPAHLLLLTQHIRAISFHDNEQERIVEIERLEGGLGNDTCTLREKAGGRRVKQRWRRWAGLQATEVDAETRLSAAVCLPLNEDGVGQPARNDLPLHVFFPTLESLGVKALIHASLDVESSRKHARPGEWDAAIADLVRDCLERCIEETPSATALAAFGEVKTERDEEPLASLCQSVRELLQESAFVEVVGGHRVAPRDARIWDDRLGEVVKPESEDVRKHNLVVPQLLEYAEVLQSLGAERISDWEHLRLLQECRSATLAESVQSFRALLHGGVSRAARMWRKEERVRALRLLQDVPCWWTEDGETRRLSDAPVKLPERPERWPAWLPADVIHADIAFEIRSWQEQQKDAPPRGSFDDPADAWRELTSEHLASRRQEFLSWVLVPTIEDWSDRDWESLGWEALALYAGWGAAELSQDTRPWLPPREGARDTLRDRLARSGRVPVEEGWVRACDGYAGAAWEGPAEFDEAFAGRVLRPPSDWPDDLRQPLSLPEWSSLLRSVSVSWEPKPRPLASWGCQHPLWEQYSKDASLHQFRHLRHDWELEEFPACVSGIGNVSRLTEVLAPLREVLEESQAAYLKKSTATRTTLRATRTSRPISFSERLGYLADRRSCIQRTTVLSAQPRVHRMTQTGRFRRGPWAHEPAG